MASDGVTLYRNRRDAFTAEAVGPAGSAPSGDAEQQLLAGDYDGDGDLDVLARAGARLAYWRNDGGSLNHWLRIRLRGKNENNSKNNSQGLFVRIESRAGDSYQAVLGNGGVNHLGIGAYRQADVLRVIWTNGLSQTWAALAADQTLDEEQVLKGSCPFLYTWNGDRFEFVTDLMWKSPLGMVLADGSPAPHQSARDFVLVPGEHLQPAGGELWLQVTEELWETVYVDRQQLLAVDYPRGVDLVVDEKFTPPPHPETPVHALGRPAAGAAGGPRPRRPRRALADPRPGREARRRAAARSLPRDDRRALSRARLRRRAGRRPDAARAVGLDLPHGHEHQFRALPVRRAGAEPPSPGAANDGRVAHAGALDQLPHRQAQGHGHRPRHRLAGGRASPCASRPTCRSTGTRRILALGEPEVTPVITPLEPARADLHYRGFSKLVRESESAPHLFDYAQVSTVPPFRDLSGRYTRFGPVRDLLTATDDLYVVMNAGDEMTVRYSTADLPELPPGWKRDYILHTDGWVKDGDINTESSQTVTPLPHHGMASYPDPRERFPRRPGPEAVARRVPDPRSGRSAVQKAGSSADACALGRSPKRPGAE